MLAFCLHWAALEDHQDRQAHVYKDFLNRDPEKTQGLAREEREENLFNLAILAVFAVSLFGFGLSELGASPRIHTDCTNF